MRKPLLFLCALVLSLAAASAGAYQAKDENFVTMRPGPTNAQMQKIFDAVLADPDAYAPRPLARGDLCAIGALPGPGDSFNIRFGLFNVIGDTVNVAILDSFNA